ncbi:hypothetical protein [Thalassotalea aquiviva]|uniref:hypothetical protein n=1 Tax=Thalassotalea aquiviva TaxID=3242415 RepID=UPI00352B1053
MKSENVLMFLPAALFYFAGAFVWCMRSQARRKDTPSKFAKSILNTRIPDTLYELLPFIQFGVGVSVTQFLSHDLALFGGCVLIFLGAKNLIMRIINRRKYSADLSFGRRLAKQKLNQ